MFTPLQRLRLAVSLLLIIGLGDSAGARAEQAGHVAQPIRPDRYTPVPGGWQLRIDRTAEVSRKSESAKYVDAATGRLTPDAPIGWLKNDPHMHRSVLFPPADKSMIWAEAEMARTQRVPFRPVVVAHHAPRFLFDYHSAGGVLGLLFIGVVPPGRDGRWLHECSRIDIRYVNGRLEYEIRDVGLGNAVVRLVALPLAGSAGVIVRIEIEGADKDTTLVWAYGGASASFAFSDVDDAQFRFSPGQCAKDRYVLEAGSFELTRAFDKSDEIMIGEGWKLCAMKELPEWKARVRGGSSWTHAVSGFGDPRAFQGPPAGLLAATRWSSTGSTVGNNCVVVQKLAQVNPATDGFIVVGMGGDIREAIASPQAAFDSGLKRNESIARRIVSRTPDPYLDSAMTMMAFANEGLWGADVYLHGGWSWRMAYVGWRSMYGPICYGWTDRVRQAIRTHCRLGHITFGPNIGAVSSRLEVPGFFYNMNEVFFDMIRHYWEYTGDVELMKEIFPVLETAIERENRRLRPGPEPLYENALNTWVSDCHWYIRGQCTQASAYMLRAHEFMADVAGRIGRDPAPFRKQADDIRTTANRVLWQQRKGVFADSIDTRGHKLLHGEPELATIYHSAEFGAADPLQIGQMLVWADTNLRRERTPGNGFLYWSSNWFPNAGRSYTHSTYELAYGENLNFADTNYLAGRADLGYAILSACASGMFNGPTPGQLSCHVHTDGTQRENDCFADSTSMFGRAACEGLFGIRVDRPRRTIRLSPQPPAAWPEMSIQTPNLSYDMKRRDDGVDLTWRSPEPAAIQLSLPVRAERVMKMRLDGRTLAYQLRPGVGFTWIDAHLPESHGGTVEVTYTSCEVEAPPPAKVTHGRACSISLPVDTNADVRDVQGLLADARIEGGRLTGRVVGTPGPGLLFVSEKTSECPKWLPVAIDIKPEKPMPARRWSIPNVPDRDLDRWHLIDLAAVYNASVPEVPRRLREGAIAPELPADQIGFGYWLDFVTVRSKPPCDSAWRAKIGADGVGWTTDGIPFKSPREGPNIAAAAVLNRDFKPVVSFPVHATGRTLYLMISGMTHPPQTHVTNVRITLTCADGSSETHDLVNPFDIGDCWSTWCGPHFDTPANGFENIGGRRGPAGTSQVKDRTLPVLVDTIAHLIALDLPTGKQLKEVRMEVIANDVVFGLMGASILEGEARPNMRGGAR